MLQQTTDLGKTPAREFWSVSDEHAAARVEIGRQLRMFDTKRQADLYGRRLREVARLIKQGADPRYAFPPRVNVQEMIAVVNASPNVRPRTTRLNEFIPSGTMVEHRHIAAVGPLPGS
jgi:hypothetical protein